MSLQVAGNGVINYSDATTISVIATAFDNQFTRILNNSLEGYMTRFAIESAAMNEDRDALVVTWPSQFAAGTNTFYTIYYGLNETSVIEAATTNVVVGPTTATGQLTGQFPVADATRYYIKVVAEARNVTDSATYYLHSEVVEGVADISTLEYEEPLPLFAGYSNYLESSMDALASPPANVILSSTPTLIELINDVPTGILLFMLLSK